MMPLNSGSFAPSSIPTLTHWWVHTDVDTNDVIVTNWAPRVGPSTFTQAAAGRRPTNTVSGMAFSGGQGLTNDPIAVINTASGSKASMWLVFTPLTPATRGSLFSDETGDHTLATTPSGDYDYFASSGGISSVGSYVAGVTYDLALVYTNVGNPNTVFTNTVQMFARPSAQPYNENQRFLAYDPFGGAFKGFIKEFAIFSDVLTMQQLTNLHNYATNLYGYSP
jgi:hypothetical protein